MDHAGRPSAPPGPVLKVCFPSVRASVLENLNRQREEGQLCDLSIQVQGHVFRAHRCVLAASSPYFHDQVLLKNVTTVSLPSVMDPMAFESVLNSAYTGQLSIVREDIVSYVTVASFLQMWHIVDKCTDILKRSRPLPQLSPCGATSSSHQSPSSSDCCFADAEEREAGPERRALPPLATWRRPQARGTRLSLQGPPVPSWTPAAGETEPGCARNRARARLRDPAERMREDEEQRRKSERWMEADEGVGELLEQDKVRVKCEAGGPEPEGRLGEGQADGACAAGPWEPAVDWALHTPAARKHEEQEQEEMDVAHFEGTFQTYDEIEEGTGQVSQRPLLPASPDPFALGPAQPQTASPGSCSCPPLAAPSSPLSGTAYTGKVHFCHCGKAYTMKSMRDRHVKMQHLNLRPFACPVCSKSFKMKHHLTKHVKTHEGLLPYECSLCGKKIVWRDSFLKHQARCQRLSAGPSGLKREEEEEEEEEEGGGSLGFEQDGEEVKVERDDYSSQEEEALLNIKL